LFVTVAPNQQDNAEALQQCFRGRRVYVAGHQGMVGSALLRALEPLGTVTVTRTSRELDLRNQAATVDFFRSERPQIVLFAAARVGGIQANANAPAEFLYDNLAMTTHAIQAAYESGVERFEFVGSMCVYPRLAPQPIAESALLTGTLEPTNEGYALAKIAGLKLCQFYRRQYGVLFHSLMPTNLYGPGDKYQPDRAHVLPALLRRFHDAKVEGQPSVVIWGTGQARREFLHVDDLAAAILHLAALAEPPDWVNVGSGEEVSILELARIVAEVVGYNGEIVTDSTRPDGMLRRLADSSLIRSTGWQPRIALREGIEQTYRAFVSEAECEQLRQS
jgi:GDP-L-fucose synthase